jgi:hypothetical protein
MPYTQCRDMRNASLRIAGLREIERFLPTCPAKRRWNSESGVNVELPLFPSYAFVHNPWGQRVRVLAVPGAVSIVGGLASRRAEPHPLQITGQRVRIPRGAFPGTIGIVQQIRNQYCVVLTVDLIMQGIAVEVDIEELAPVAV